MAEDLAAFAEEHGFAGKGPLCVALVVTEHAKNQDVPLTPDSLVTPGGGQVRGLSKNAVQSILRRHGIERGLAAEGGRTSRGSPGRMREYAAYLNQAGSGVDLDAIELFWIGRVRNFFEARPLRLNADPSKGIRIHTPTWRRIPA